MILIIITIMIFLIAFTFIQSQGTVEGYSSINKELTTNKCFKYHKARIENSRADLKYSGAITYGELTNIFSKFYSYTVGGCRKRTKSGTYIREIKQRRNTFNINYLFKMNAEVAIEYDIFGDGILTDFGKQVYNQGTNPYFRTICGDYLLTKGKVEYMLSFSFKISLTDYTDAAQVFGDAPTGDVNAAAAKIAEAARTLGVNGEVSVNAIQIGGDEKRLKSILNGSESLYNANCNLKDFSRCQAAINRLMDYATEDFPSQISSERGAFNLDGLIKTDLEKIAVKTYKITPKILRLNEDDEVSRKEMLRIYLENMYYDRELNKALDNYSGLQKYQAEINKAQFLASKALYNLKLYEPGSELFDSISNCQIYPNQCEAALIQLKNIKYTFQEIELLEAGIYKMYDPSYEDF